MRKLLMIMELQKVLDLEMMNCRLKMIKCNIILILFSTIGLII